jgi:hypothetical protein
MNNEKVMRLALEALKTLVERFDYEQFTSVCELDDAKDAIKALEEALAKQEQGKPDVVIDENSSPEFIRGYKEAAKYFQPDIKTPQQRKPLTDKVLNIIASQWHMNLLVGKDKADVMSFARAIEAAHGIKE